ncbi:T-complex protein 11-domain-containing protein [Thelephora terrestris]|uniref:T-complex protein 11-domain-containing protein n=1 Tax=Thelephora terrestris TaxID=56493 RepID=A0A9P6H5E4_9AGAM|nr:T-complex protein 11-domain-containing protein [Thelephora terrestris]
MDDYIDDGAHDSPSLGQISQKRKADSDDPSPQDCQSPEPIKIVPADGLLPIPRHHQWPTSSDGHISPQFFEESDHLPPDYRSREPKRPKIQVAGSSPTGSGLQHRRKETPSSPQHGGGRPDDSPHGYLESITRSDLSKSRRHHKPSALSTIDWDSPYIPSFLPIPNRETLKELELEVVLCNPQLRHDLLFDSGLQFRPTSSRRKRYQAELYWSAIARELECHCTCITWDENGRVLAEPVCICGDFHSPSTHNAAVILPNFRGKTLRTASRIRNLFSELLEVLLSIIQPLPSAMFNPTPAPTTFQPAPEKFATQGDHIRSLLDPELIQQEIYHGVWDASGLFRLLGETLKCHCAPMRDHNVEAMIQTAQSCVDGRNIASLTKAIRMCFDVLEFMKLDLANHLLQGLRPYLLRSAPEYERMTFQDKKKRENMDLAITRAWVRKAFTQLSTATRPNAIDPQASATIFRSLRRSIQINIVVIKALINLVFNPKLPEVSSPVSASPAADATAPRVSPTFTTRSPCLAVEIPETLFLDVARLGVYITDAVDLTAIYMLLLLYRQLVFSETSRSGWAGNGKVGRKIVEAELMKLKSEIWAIAPPRLGSCFIPEARKLDTLGSSSRYDGHRSGDKERSRTRSSKSEQERWRKSVRDVALHVAARSKDFQWRAEAAKSQASSIPRLAPLESMWPTLPPNPAMLGLVEGWCESNLKFGSPLSVHLREKLADAMLHTVMACYHNVNNLPPPSRPTPMSVSVLRDSQGAPQVLNQAGLLQYLPSDTVVGGSLGMETLNVEMKGIAERIAKLAKVHVDVYGVMYESQDGFLVVDV